MKSTKLFNNISDELKKLIPKLKPGETKVFQLTNGVPNPEPDEKERIKQGAILYPKVQLMTQFRIFDKFKGNGGEYVDMALADSWAGDNPSKVRCFVPGNENGLQGSRFQGKFQVTGGVVREEELFEIMFLSPQRKDSPCPDPSIEQIFELVDITAGNQAKMTKFEKLERVVEITKSITPADARRVMKSLNQPDYQDDATLLAQTKDYATRNVEAFLNTFDSKESHIKEAVVDAIAAGVLAHDIPTGDISVGGAIVANIKVSTADVFPDAFVKWLESAENGKDVLANIQAQMKKKKAPAQA